VATVIYGAIAWALSGFIPMILAGAGVSLVVYAALFPVVETLLTDSILALNGLPQVALQLALLGGAGEALSITGSALLTRMAITSVANIAGLKVN